MTPGRNYYRLSYPVTVTSPGGPDWPADPKHLRDRRHLHRHLRNRGVEPHKPG